MKKAFFLFILLFSLFLSASPVAAQTFEWARKTGTGSIATGSAVATEEQGNCYQAGSFFGVSYFDEFKFRGVARDGYLVKYDRDGKVLWAKDIAGKGDEFANALGIDKDGNCLLAGSFAFTVDLGGDTLSSAGQHDIFLAKYDPKGALIWSKRAGGYYEDHAMALATDRSGNTFVAGFFKDTLRFEGGKILAGLGISGYNIFLAKYDSKGNVVWANKLGSSSYPSQNEGLAIATDQNGMVYVTGSYQRDAAFDSKKFTNRGGYSLFLAKYDQGGKLIWVKSAGSEGSAAVGRGLAVDKKGNCYVGGTFMGKPAFDSISIMTRNLSYSDVFLAKYNTDGDALWVRNSNGFGPKLLYSVRTDAESNPYIIGSFQDTCIFGNMTMAGKGTDHLFVVKYDAKGEPVWSRQAGRHGGVHGRDLAFDKSGNIFLTGNFSDTIELGKNTLMAYPHAQDAYFAKLSTKSLVKEKLLPDPPPADFSFYSASYESKSQTITLKYSIPRASFILLDIYDLGGSVTESYIESERQAGTYEIKLDAKNIPKGAEYYIRLQAGTLKQSKKLELGK
ncbi:MAG: SBBP repeat-containing protein [Ignavibacteriota bacterium]